LGEAFFGEVNFVQFRKIIVEKIEKMIEKFPPR